MSGDRKAPEYPKTIYAHSIIDIDGVVGAWSAKAVSGDREYHLHQPVDFDAMAERMARLLVTKDFDEIEPAYGKTVEELAEVCLGMPELYEEIKATIRAILEPEAATGGEGD